EARAAGGRAAGGRPARARGRAAAGLIGAHGPSLPARGAVRRALPLAALPAAGVRFRFGDRRHVPRRDRRGVPRAARASQAGRDRHQPGRALRADKDRARRRRKESLVERPLRLIAANPLDSLARVIEALLVVATAPLPTEELCEAAQESPERIETALGLLGERYREGRR